MPFTLTRNETQTLMQGKLNSITRKVGEEIPWQMGEAHPLLSEFAKGGAGRRPVAMTTIMSIRPMTMGEHMEDDTMCQSGGFENASVFRGHMESMYGGIEDTDRVVRIQLRVDNLKR